jgi:transcriptional regulator with XRE-family HTH domain
MITYFAEQLQKLFDIKRKPDGTPYSQEDVLQGTHGVLTRGALWKLRAGRTKNPSYESIKALADFFGVSPAYFFEAPGDKDQAVIDDSSLRPGDEIDLNKIAMRAVDITDPRTKDVILGMIQFIQNFEVGRKHENAIKIESEPGKRDTGDGQDPPGSGNDSTG